jgi:hypothetical protein
MKKYLFTMATLLLLLTGCASTVTEDIKVDADSDPKANLAGYKSYTWLGSASIVFDDEGQWEPPGFDADAEVKFLIDRELRKHGMAEDSANPDLFVAFAAGIDMDTMELKTNPDDGLEVLENVPVGALTVILIDTETGFAVWAGVATAKVQENPTQETIKKRLDYAVSQMFAKLPH